MAKQKSSESTDEPQGQEPEESGAPEPTPSETLASEAPEVAQAPVTFTREELRAAASAAAQNRTFVAGEAAQAEHTTDVELGYQPDADCVSLTLADGTVGPALPREWAKRITAHHKHIHSYRLETDRANQPYVFVAEGHRSFIHRTNGTVTKL